MVIFLVSGSDLHLLKNELKRSKRRAFAPGTRQNLKTQIYSFYAFCLFFNKPWLSVDSETLSLYAQFLARSFKSPESIKNYIKGIKTFYLMVDLPKTAFEDLELKLTLRGISRLKRHVPTRAEPVTPQILLEIHSLLDLTLQLHSVFWALFLVAFFSMSRKSNLVFTPSKYSPNHMILRKDVTVFKDHLVLTFRSSKTNQFGKRVHTVPLVAIPGSPLCPVTAFTNMCSKVDIPINSPAFSLLKNKTSVPVTYSKFQGFFRLVLSLLGYQATKFSSHSFRRGGATWAFTNSVPGELIKDHGGWASEAYLLYLDMSFDNKLLVSKTMSVPLSKQ